MKRHNHKGIKVSIRPFNGLRLKIQAQELQKTSFEVSVVWKHPAVKAVQCKLHVWLCGQISAVYFYTLLNTNARTLVNLLANAFRKHWKFVFPLCISMLKEIPDINTHQGKATVIVQI